MDFLYQIRYRSTARPSDLLETASGPFHSQAVRKYRGPPPFFSYPEVKLGHGEMQQREPKVRGISSSERQRSSPIIRLGTCSR